MSLSSLQLDAFFQVTKQRSFSKAALTLGVTQSALSQRVKNLELDLGTTLFIRDNSNFKITESGEKLMRFCLIKNSLEDDLLLEIKSDFKGEFRGTIRIASFSSVLRSIVIPSLAKFLRENPLVKCEFIKAEMNELVPMLKRGEADFIILDHSLNQSGILEQVLGNEEYVVIENPKLTSRDDVYLDHDPDDNATESFFNYQSKKPKSYRRTFMGDVYGILDGVKLGLGKAVMSKHLIPESKEIRIIKGYKRDTRSVILHQFDQPYYPLLFKEVKKILISSSLKYLTQF